MVDNDLQLKQLVRKAKEGDEKSFDKIIKILEPDLKKISSKYYIVGSDEQDVLQECRIGVWKSIKDYNEEGGMTFKNFSVNVCVKRHLITAMSHANTQKFKLHNEAFSLSAPSSMHGDDENSLTFADSIPDPSSDLLKQYIVHEEFNVNIGIISDKLTDLECSIFEQYAYNSSYKDIATALNVKPKTVDNALMRIRKKSQEAYQSYLKTHSVIGYATSTFLDSLFIYKEKTYTGIGTQFAII
jgi:RNA polymerase sporulation-specific sigma factor